MYRVLFYVMSVCMVISSAGASEYLNNASNWKAMGSANGKIKVTKDAEDNAIKISGDFSPKKTGTVWPLCRIKEGKFSKVSSIEFELKLLPSDCKYTQGAIILPPMTKEKISGKFNFALPAVGKWKKISVPFNRAGYDMSTVRNIQILFTAEGNKFSVLVRNIKLLDSNNKEIE